MKSDEKKGIWYTNKDHKHNKNETTYASKGREFILQQVINEFVGEKHNKLVQFITLFHTLKHGRRMFEYEIHKDLFEFLNLEEDPKMHWTKFSSYAMAQHIDGIILEATKFLIGIAQYLSLVMR